ncbi:hypothetical protein NSK_004071 [Nannochloropsis salina CCMP1776]|jgi:hypothetical protein|uniref:Uncharacterized protein n=1 Tax=Nannochloropsis salina CCMP1776 TaxID=1027361 RepID=A0A4D9CZW6_9STRA|nr:hypothetical protein NSK_004071 [Nannochloropsis salina CCMP1776]|eukprot:TFJ84606.1 hypothetical protein NSK_004071 [Nannochloropsis salina CCMP1776]
MDRTITVLKEANQYGYAGRDEKRGRDGNVKRNEDFISAQDNHNNDPPGGAPLAGRDMESALDFEGVELKNGEGWREGGKSD